MIYWFKNKKHRDIWVKVFLILSLSIVILENNFPVVFDPDSVSPLAIIYQISIPLFGVWGLFGDFLIGKFYTHKEPGNWLTRNWFGQPENISDITFIGIWIGKNKVICFIFLLMLYGFMWFFNW
jgi:hypothetical protein